MTTSENSRPQILVIDDDLRITRLVEVTLKQFGYDVLTAFDGESGLEKANEHKPDLIVLDVMMPGMDGLEVCSKLKEDNYTRYIPVIMLSAKGQLEDRISGLETGADDYVTKPFNIKELVAKVDTILSKNIERIDANPTTRLPGNFSIEKELNRRIQNDEIFAFAYVDLDNFKAYNDKYGFYKGDKIIGFTSQVLLKSIVENGTKKDFVGHVGGDDFVFITEPEKIKDVCEAAIEKFDEGIVEFYDAEDLERNYIISKNRQGILMEYPIMTISIVVITNEVRVIKHPGQISDLEGELKGYVKSLEGSNYVIDKRHDSAAAQNKEVKNQIDIFWLDVRAESVMNVVAELKRQGYNVHFSETSTAAIRKFENHKPNIILLGVKLPFIEAYNICNFLHSSPELRRIPILMISPENVFYGKSEVRKLKASSADYFTKKIDIEKLTFKIDEVVDM